MEACEEFAFERDSSHTSSTEAYSDPSLVTTGFYLFLAPSRDPLGHGRGVLPDHSDAVVSPVVS